MSATASSDDAAIAEIGDVLSVHRNTTSWFNNASFALPLLAAVIVGLFGLVLRRGDVLAFAAFLLFVTLCMVPVVLVSWRHTATAVLISDAAITSVHNGRVLKSLPWSIVTGVNRRETQGNVRWLVSTGGEQRIVLDGELEDLERLIGLVRTLAGGRAPALDSQRTE